VESVRDNLEFSLEAWPEAGIECDFALPPNVLSEALKLDPEEGETPRLLTSMRGHLSLALAGNKLRVRGFFAVKLELVCHRCLAPFTGRLDDKFDDTVQIAGTGDEDEDALSGLVPLRGQVFDLTPLMAEFFWLAWPYKALCRPDCAGLCPDCGANLNEGPCFCEGSGPTRH
jgi:uncharacterized protein